LFKTLTFAFVALSSSLLPVYARDHIVIVGSSTVFPYSQAVSEEFSAITGYSAPVVESIGTGGGFKAFCAGIGTSHPDITGASRAIKESEKTLCYENGVVGVREVLFGYDGLSLATSRGGIAPSNVTLPQLFLALSAEVPIDGIWVSNPYRFWSDIDNNLPNSSIVVYGPPPTSGTRDAFVELAMHTGCMELGVTDVVALCSRMRQDGPFIEAGENDNLIVQRLLSDPQAMGIFGYSFLYENLDKIVGVQISGVSPTLDTIETKEYPLSRPLYIYVKNEHIGVISGLDEFLEEFLSEEAIGWEGYLVERGLVPLSQEARKELRVAP
jgi:phosphate transport system substrate-binding protein